MFNTIPLGTTPCAISTSEEANRAAACSFGLSSPYRIHMMYHYLAFDIREYSLFGPPSIQHKPSAVVAKHVSMYIQMACLVNLCELAPIVKSIASTRDLHPGGSLNFSAPSSKRSV